MPRTYASSPASRLATQDSGSGGSLLLSCKALSSSTTCRFIPAHGQPDFTLNSPNRIKPESIAGPAGIVIDYSQEPFALYVSDVQNHRVLGWRDAIRFHDGQPADIVIGQPDFYSAIPNVDTPNQTPTASSLSGPRGLAVDRKSVV
jgi:hypothetical protein